MIQEEFDEWIKVSAYLKRAKAREMELRKMLLDMLAYSVGTQTSTIFDTKLKIAMTEKLTLDEDAFDSNADKMSEQELACIHHKPTLDKRKYDKLPADSVLVLNCVTRRNNTPSVTIA